MYCASCGVQNEDAARFCESCGNAMVEPAPVARRFESEPSARPETAARPAYVPNYLVQAILVTVVTVFCCLPFPFGIVAIVYAARVNGKVAAGDMAGAREASAKARTWAWVTFGIGLGFAVLWGILAVAPWGLFAPWGF